MDDTLMTTRTTVLENRAAILARYRKALDVVANESLKLSAVAQIELGLVRADLRIEHDAIAADLADRAAMFGEKEDVSDVAQPGGFQRWIDHGVIRQIHRAVPDGGG